ncbi:hypothetical protein D3C87_1662330 [compost metagenome]
MQIDVLRRQLRIRGQSEVGNRLVRCHFAITNCHAPDGHFEAHQRRVVRHPSDIESFNGVLCQELAGLSGIDAHSTHIANGNPSNIARVFAEPVLLLARRRLSNSHY